MQLSSLPHSFLQLGIFLSTLPAQPPVLSCLKYCYRTPGCLPSKACIWFGTTTYFLLSIPPKRFILPRPKPPQPWYTCPAKHWCLSAECAWLPLVGCIHLTHTQAAGILKVTFCSSLHQVLNFFFFKKLQHLTCYRKLLGIASTTNLCRGLTCHPVSSLSVCAWAHEGLHAPS